MTEQHTLAMQHYKNCKDKITAPFGFWGEVKSAVEDMEPVYKAAPDMLDMLQWVLEDLNSSIDAETAICIRATIAKAKGETS